MSESSSPAFPGIIWRQRIVLRDWIHRHRNDEGGDIAPTLVLWSVFAFVNSFVFIQRSLSPNVYHQPVILVAAIRHILPNGLQAFVPIVLVVTALAILLLLGRQRFGVRWSEIDDGSRIRVIVSVAAMLLAWMYSTYDYNFFFEQHHAFDRCLLIVLAIGIAWRPVVAFPFLFVLWLTLGQFRATIGNDSWALLILPARIVLLMATMLAIGFVTRKWPAQSFMYVLLCLIAGHYIPSGIAKLRMAWLWHDQIELLLPSTYANGWLGGLSSEMIATLTDFWSHGNVVTKPLTLILECGCVIFLWRNWTVRAFLIGWIVFHCGIVLLSGIVFWPWMVIYTILLVLSWRRPLLPNLTRTSPQFLLSVILIAGSPFWVHPARLAWIDSPATYTYRVAAIGESGNEFVVPPRGLAPFDYQFMIGAFRYASRDPLIPVTWGATSPDVYNRLRQVTSVNELFAAEAELGQPYFDAERTLILSDFLQQFARSANRTRTRRFIPWWLRAPPMILSFPSGNIYRGQEPIVRMKMTQVLTAYFDDAYREVRSRVVIDVAVDRERMDAP